MFVEFGDADSSYVHTVRADKILRLSKSYDGEVTIVHLEGGDAVRSDDSMKTISARVSAELNKKGSPNESR